MKKIFLWCFSILYHTCSDFHDWLYIHKKLFKSIIKITIYQTLYYGKDILKVLVMSSTNLVVGLYIREKNKAIRF